MALRSTGAAAPAGPPRPRPRPPAAAGKQHPLLQIDRLRNPRRYPCKVSLGGVVTGRAPAFLVEVLLASLRIADDDIAHGEDRGAAHRVVDALPQEVRQRQDFLVGERRARLLALRRMPGLQERAENAARLLGGAIEVDGLRSDDVGACVGSSCLRAMAIDTVAGPQRASAIVRGLIDDRRAGDLPDGRGLRRYGPATAPLPPSCAAPLLRRHHRHRSHAEGQRDRDLLNPAATHQISLKIVEPIHSARVHA